MKTFPAVILGIFVSMALIGVLVFATFTSSRQAAIGKVLIWGALPQQTVDNLLTDVRGTRDDFNDVSYQRIAPEQLVPQLVQAIAAGKGPDLVLFPSSSFVKDGDKLDTVPYSSVSKRDFQDAFVQAGEIFLTPDGIKGFPLTVDPLVMYWNRTLFSNAGIASPPKYWDDLATIAPQLTQKAQNGSLTVSAIALGGWSNVTSAKSILITLIDELGSPVVSIDANGRYQTGLTDTTEAGIAPADSAVRYYTDFADPVKPVYSWNRSQKTSRDAFLAGTLALYIGPASDLLPLRAANPNLNFDVAQVPSVRGGGSEVTAEVSALSIPRGALNPKGAATVAIVLTGPTSATSLAAATHMPSARRDVELDASADAYLSTFRQAALKSFAFLDPDPIQSDAIFQRMIDAVSSGKARLSDAVRSADEELIQLLPAQ